jgi:hypothetical protein
MQTFGGGYPHDSDGVAELFLREIGDPPAPACAFELAWAARISVHHGAPSRTDGVRIYVPRQLSGPARHWCVAHELGHALLARAGLRQTEQSADRIAAGLMLPLAAVVADFAMGASGASMLRRHRNCSAELIAARMTEAAAILRPRALRGSWRARDLSAHALPLAV